MLQTINKIQKLISNYELIAGYSICPSGKWANEFEFAARTFKVLRLEVTPSSFLEEMYIKLVNTKSLVFTVI